jgi:hypothetical protein
MLVLDPAPPGEIFLHARDGRALGSVELPAGKATHETTVRLPAPADK